jgi:hypothetical protein
MWRERARRCCVWRESWRCAMRISISPALPCPSPLCTDGMMIHQFGRVLSIVWWALATRHSRLIVPSARARGQARTSEPAMQSRKLENRLEYRDLTGGPGRNFRGNLLVKLPGPSALCTHHYNPETTQYCKDLSACAEAFCVARIFDRGTWSRIALNPPVGRVLRRRSRGDRPTMPGKAERYDSNPNDRRPAAKRYCD